MLITQPEEVTNESTTTLAGPRMVIVACWPTVSEEKWKSPGPIVLWTGVSNLVTNLTPSPLRGMGGTTTGCRITGCSAGAVEPVANVLPPRPVTVEPGPGIASP